MWLWILYKFGQDFRFSGLLLEFLIQWIWGAVWKSSTGPQLWEGQEIRLISLLWSSPWEKAVLILKENCVLYSAYSRPMTVTLLSSNDISTQIAETCEEETKPRWSSSFVTLSLETSIAENHLAAAKSLQLCPTLCDPIDGSPPGSPVPGILQARTLEWVAISFSTEWKWKVKVKLLSRILLLATPWTAAYQASPSIRIFQAKVLEWGAIAFSENHLGLVLLSIGKGKQLYSF